MAPDQRTTAVFPDNHSSKQNVKTKPPRTIRKFTIPPPLKMENLLKRTPLSHTSSVQERLEKARYNVKKEYKAMTSSGKSCVTETPYHHDYWKEEKKSQGFFYKGMDSTSPTPANDRLALLRKKLDSDGSVATSVVEVNNLENALCSTQANEKNADFMVRESKTCENVDCNLDLPFTTLEEARQSWAAFTKHTHQQAKSESVSTNNEKPHEMTIDKVSSLNTMTIEVTPSRAHSCFAEAAQDYFRLQEIEEQRKKQQKPSNNPQNINAYTYTNGPDLSGEVPKRQ